MPSSAASEHDGAHPTPRTRARRRWLLPATAALGAAIGATATIWLHVDHNRGARELVGGGLVAVLVLTATLGTRLGEQRRWRRLVEQSAHPAAASVPGSLAAQAEAARQFVGADAAAIVWSDGPDSLSVGALAGSAPPRLRVGAALGATAMIPPGRRSRWTPGHELPDGDPCRVEGTSVVARPLAARGELAGTIVMWSARPTVGARLRLSRAARAGAAAIERARLDDAERRSRLGASHARRHLAMLVAASATLARAIDDWQPAFEALASEIVPLHADYFAVDLIRDDGGLERVAAAHADPGRIELSRRPERDWPGWRDEMRDALGHSHVLLFHDRRGGVQITDAARPGDGISALHRSLELESWAIVPIRVRTDIVGAISVGTLAHRRGLRPSDVETYEELASRSALTIERVRLYTASESAARVAEANAARLVRAVEAAPTLASSLNVADILQRTARQAFRTMDARLAAVQLTRRGAAPVIAWWPAVPSFQESARQLLSGGASPRPRAAVPIVLPGSASSGVLVVDRPPGQNFSSEEESVLRLLSQLTDAAIRHAEVYEAAVTNERRLQALVEASPLAIIEVDGRGKVLSHNPAAASLFRWHPAMGARLLPSEVSDMFPGLRKRLSAGHTVVADRTVVHWPDGHALSLSVAAAIVPRQTGSDDDLVCILTDVTQRELLEREVQQKQRMEALGRLAGGVAHDFNNLLTVIVGYSDLLARRLGDGHPSYGDVDAIRVAGQQAAAFTEQLLTISHNRVLEMRAVDLARAVHNLEPVLRRLVGDNVVFIIDAPPESGHIAIDEGQLEQVLLNLVVNAQDAMPDGGTLVITTGLVGADEVELTVRDTGVGMDAATLERCFDPFFTTKGRSKGTGLGLATVYGVIDQAGGEITVESTEGRGTLFQVVFPSVAAAEVEPALAAGAAPARTNGGSGSDRVLLVEDEREVRAYARLVLDDAGFRVVEAADGREALAVASRLTGPPAILVTDVLMPGMSGPELAAELTAAHPGLPVLYLSGYVDDERREQLLRDTPSSRFLAKPFRPAELVAAVDGVLDAAADLRSAR